MRKAILEGLEVEFAMPPLPLVGVVGEPLAWRGRGRGARLEIAGVVVGQWGGGSYPHPHPHSHPHPRAPRYPQVGTPCYLTLIKYFNCTQLFRVVVSQYLRNFFLTRLVFSNNFISFKLCAFLNDHTNERYYTCLVDDLRKYFFLNRVHSCNIKVRFYI